MRPKLDECLTLRRSEERIKREIKVAAGSGAVSLVDQMLLKFYLKHIEDNLNELSGIYERLMGRLGAGEAVDEELKEGGAGHKLAINGHKLVFICDTLERNLTNTHLKTALHEASAGLCDSLKLYMIRIKTTSLAAGSDQSAAARTKQRLVVEALQGVLGAANRFKQVIIKYYFKSY